MTHFQCKMTHFEYKQILNFNRNRYRGSEAFALHHHKWFLRIVVVLRRFDAHNPRTCNQSRDLSIAGMYIQIKQRCTRTVLLAVLCAREVTLSDRCPTEFIIFDTKILGF